MTSFIDRFDAAFGRGQALLLRLSGLTAAEVSAEGPWVHDADGRSWLDFGSFGVHLLGHLHPDVVAAARDQLRHMGLSTKIMGNSAATACAEALIASTGGALDHVVFANSGAEAVEVSLKMAMLATGRRKLLAFRHGYHGKTLAALSLSDGWDRAQIGINDRVDIADLDDFDAVARLLETEEIAAAIIEPVQGEGGIRPVTATQLVRLQEVCALTGTILVVDEIQTGLGRCGRVWRSVPAQVVPDVLLVGKGLGGGLVPVSAAMFRTASIAERVADPVVLASSFAGGALAARVGETVVDLVSAPGFLDGVTRQGDRVMSHLRTTWTDDPAIVDVRGEGLMIGLELCSPGLAGQVVLEAARRRLLVTFCLHDPSVVRVYPPAVCTDVELDVGIARLVDAVAEARQVMDEPIDELTRR
jgi:acetylornithine aminotransferase/putrescine aminotransferase